MLLLLLLWHSPRICYDFYDNNIIFFVNLLFLISVFFLNINPLKTEKKILKTSLICNFALINTEYNIYLCRLRMTPNINSNSNKCQALRKILSKISSLSKISLKSYLKSCLRSVIYIYSKHLFNYFYLYLEKVRSVFSLCPIESKILSIQEGHKILGNDFEPMMISQRQNFECWWLK